MSDPTNFLTTMAALSTAVQTFVDHIVKGRWPWLNNATPNNAKNEERRQSMVHLIAFVVGGVMAFSVHLKPLTYLGLGDGAVANYFAAGILVSFGSSFFNEALDAVRAFKKAQEGVRQTQISAGISLPNVTS
jgi:predicted membrane channel-forming protein YqfA (hemolysin III family)